MRLNMTRLWHEVSAALGRGHQVAGHVRAIRLERWHEPGQRANQQHADRRDPQRCFGLVHQSLSLFCLLGGLAMIGIGVQVSAVLLMVFGLVGVLAGWGGLRARRKAAGDPRWWLKTHYGAMIGNGVATHIAFLAIGINRLIPGIDPALQQAVAWFGPLLVAVMAALWLNRRYGRPAAASTTRGPKAGGAQAQV